MLVLLLSPGMQKPFWLWLQPLPLKHALRNLATLASICLLSASILPEL